MGTRVSVAAAAVLLPVFGLVPAHAGAASIPRVQRLAQVMTPHGVRARPDGHARVIEVVQPLRPITRERTILPVLAHRRGKQGVMWLKVLLRAGRTATPAGSSGSAPSARRPGGRSSSTSRSAASTSSAADGSADSFRAVVGKPSTPTPRPLLRRGVVQPHSGRARRAVRARTERALERLPGVRRRPRPDRAPRDLSHRRHPAMPSRTAAFVSTAPR